MNVRVTETSAATSELKGPASSDEVRRRETSRWLSWKRLAIGGCVALALGAAGVYATNWLRWGAAHVSEDDARVAGEVITIASRLDGWLVARPVIEGDLVKRGQVLAQIDDRDARSRLAAVERSAAAADAQIKQTTAQRDTTDLLTKAGIDDARAQIAAAHAAVASAGHQAELAQADFQRADALLKTGNTTQKAWDDANATLLQRRDAQRQTEAQLQSRQAALATAEAQRGQVDVLSRQIDVQTQQRLTLSAQADELRQEVADRNLVSPVDGVVDKTLADVGDFAQPGQWVMMVHDPKDVWVEANIKETEVGRVEIGQPVDVTVDAYPDLVLKGRVLRVGNAATSQFALLPSPNPSGNFTKITQRVPVRIALDKPDSRLRPGLMVEVAINVAH